MEAELMINITEHEVVVMVTLSVTYFHLCTACTRTHRHDSRREGRFANKIVSFCVKYQMLSEFKFLCGKSFHGFHEPSILCGSKNITLVLNPNLVCE